MMMTNRKLAELIALKGRVTEAREATLLGFERAIAEIIYIARMETIEMLREQFELGADVTEALGNATDRAAYDHQANADETRHSLMGHLVGIRGSVEPDQWPPKGSPAAHALMMRAGPGYDEVRRRLQRRGIELQRERSSAVGTGSPGAE